MSCKNIFALLIAVLVSITNILSCLAEDMLQMNISLPPGFSIHIYADNVPNARSMALSPNNVLFVGSRKAGNVYAVIDKNRDYIADETIIIAEGLNMPNGVAFRNGDLYVAEIHRIIKFPEIEKHLYDPEKPEIVFDALPSKTWHGWKFIKFGPDGKLYVPIGAPCNVCESQDRLLGTITRMGENGDNFEIFAKGVRNSVGFDWHPENQELWFTDNGRDMLGDNLPPDELNHAPRAGLHFGFPYLHGNNVIDPEYGTSKGDIVITKPAQELGPHVASLGMQFYTGTMFPKEYVNQIFIAEHGSWNRSVPIGYRISIVRLENSKPTGYEIFAQGWLQKHRVLGRPVDIEMMPDGSLLVSDDYSNRIYRIIYKTP
ncbi:MAG: sorbosone dehydrogenase family protein [Deltaproteobacteria bacterium]|nr:MAG: sorbosone dehydrogenase family protein [Deltaproteobacteria bacterium]